MRAQLGESLFHSKESLKKNSYSDYVMTLTSIISQIDDMYFIRNYQGSVVKGLKKLQKWFHDISGLLNVEILRPESSDEDYNNVIDLDDFDEAF